mmetsp:Transcript_35450/g.63228  ORF Transcript_35450/g.63228 Transcript_35450/m.63228 type:complete len:236 (+) Transcript_35450:284-991(+)
MDAVLFVSSNRLSLSDSVFTFTFKVETSPESRTSPGLAPGGLETCRQRTTFTPTLPFCGPLEYLAAKVAASVSVSIGTSLSWQRITICEPGYPATCIHQSGPSRCSGLHDSRSLSEAPRPTRISMPSAEVYTQYGLRGGGAFPFTFLGPRGGRSGGESPTFSNCACRQMSAYFGSDAFLTPSSAVASSFRPLSSSRSASSSPCIVTVSGQRSSAARSVDSSASSDSTCASAARNF